MKILVVGQNSFIAKTFMNGLAPDSYTTLSVRDDGWKSFDYTTVDTIVYFAAIVHHPEITDEALHDKVNAEIPYGMAKLAKLQGLKKFIFISTMAVVGLGPKFGCVNTIDRKTPSTPVTPYGRSKKKGEDLLKSIDGLCVQLVRLPNVYGKDCPGTFYHRIEQLATFKFLPVYSTNYKFSLISVDNVAKALRKLLTIDKSDVYCPQDYPIISITDRVRNLAKTNGIEQKQFAFFAPCIWLANKMLPKKFTDNLFGGYYIDPADYPVLTD